MPTRPFLPGALAAARPSSRVYSETSAIPKAITVVGTVIAPTTLLTALAFYFGRLHATGFCRYFGVDYTLLNLTAADYLVRSADGMIVPLGVAAVVALLVLWLHQLLPSLVPRRHRGRGAAILMVIVGVAGTVLVTFAIAATLGALSIAGFPEARGLSLSIGVLLLAYGARLLRSRARERNGAQHAASESVIVAEWGVIFILVSVGLFWAVGSYAVLVGASRGAALAAQLSSAPDVVLYSEKDLGFGDAPGLTTQECPSSNAAYRYRYEGLRMAVQSDNQYLLLPSEWTPSEGAAMLISRNDSIRLEFDTNGGMRNPTC